MGEIRPRRDKDPRGCCFLFSADGNPADNSAHKDEKNGDQYSQAPFKIQKGRLGTGLKIPVSFPAGL